MFLKQFYMKKSLHVGVFNPDLIMQASPMCGDNVFYKGFKANGYESFLFDYRAEQNPNERLIEYAKTVEWTKNIISSNEEQTLDEAVRELTNIKTENGDIGNFLRIIGSIKYATINTNIIPVIDLPLEEGLEYRRVNL